MNIATIASRESGRWLPLRFALRELRGGLRGFYVFITCIALGCMAIAGVGSLAASLADGLARGGRRGGEALEFIMHNLSLRRSLTSVALVAAVGHATRRDHRRARARPKGGLCFGGGRTRGSAGGRAG